VNSSERAHRLGNDRIPSLLATFSIPAIVGMIVQAIYNVVDRIFIANGVGMNGLAALTVSFPIMLILMAFGMLIGFGANSIISISLGQKKEEYAERVLGNAVTLLSCGALAITAVGEIFLEPILIAFGASPETLPDALIYTRIILAGSIVNGIGFGMNNFIRGEGNPRYAMGSMLIGAGTNLVLDPVMIFWFGWGVAGAAIATVIGQALSCAWVLTYFLSGRSHLKLRKRNLRLDSKIVSRICAVGSAPFSLQISHSVTNAIVNNQLQVHGGDIALSVMGVLYSTVTIFMMPIFGLNQGAQPIIGYNFGAGQYRRVRRTVGFSAAAATALLLFGWLLTRLAPDFVISLFNRGNTDMLAMGVHAMGIYLMFWPLIGFQVITSGYFQATGRPAWAMLLSLSRQVLFLIPLVVFLPRFYGLDGVWWAMPVSDLLSVILSVTVFIRELRFLRSDRPYTGTA